ncbi:MAG: 3-deoxy-manno-octulosonate cytidylyltransferase [Syntrophales bacterium]|nr:3-deoxy-manno-octulosonate cytidylyltransferase [Syntrophales bacterium]
MKKVAVIPSRLASTRFPGKPLALLKGKPIIQHVYERATSSPLIDYTVVATDSKEIFETVRRFGGEVVMTATDHRSGTDRVNEAATILNLSDYDIVVNIQGDQPTFEPKHIEEVVMPLMEDDKLLMTTLVYKITNKEDVENPNIVKAVLTNRNFALYFSRSPIPYIREKNLPYNYYKHHGIYAYRRYFLRIFSNLPTGVLERLESLEQLRALEYGYPIKVVESAYDSIEIDTKEDLERLSYILENS